MSAMTRGWSRNPWHQGAAAVLLGLVLAWTLMWFTAAAAQESSSQAKPPLLSAAELEYPPFCFLGPDGQLTGFSIELFQAALKAMGREVTFQLGPWAEVKDWLAQGKVQALPLVGRTPEREEVFDFTVPT